MSWFRYERHAGRWCPVVYHDTKPNIPKGEEDRFTGAIEVPTDCLSTSGEPMFGRLQAKFPAPTSTT